MPPCKPGKLFTIKYGQIPLESPPHPQRSLAAASLPPRSGTCLWGSLLSVPLTECTQRAGRREQATSRVAGRKRDRGTCRCALLPPGRGCPVPAGCARHTPGLSGPPVKKEGTPFSHWAPGCEEGSSLVPGLHCWWAQTLVKKSLDPPPLDTVNNPCPQLHGPSSQRQTLTTPWPPPLQSRLSPASTFSNQDRAPDGHSLVPLGFGPC